MSRTTEPDSEAKVATLLAGPGIASNSTSSVSENVGFRFVLDRTVQTLSSNGLPKSGTFSGLLFVPSLAPQDPCNSITSPFIPSNVTRHEDVADYGYPVIAFAPWVSPACTQSFLAASREIGTEALIFFQPSSNETEIPPPLSDERWDLNDGGQWTSQNDYPVYAIPGPAGRTLIRELAWISDETRNSSSNGSHASAEQQSDKNRRLFTMIDADTPAKGSTEMWRFVLAIMGLVVGLSLVAVFLTLWLRRRQREDIRRQMQARQVDIENLGLTPLNAPCDLVESMPLYIWPGPEALPHATTTKDETETNVVELGTNNNAARQTINEGHRDVEEAAGIKEPEPAVINPTTDHTEPTTNLHRARYTQTTCAICLEDFVAGSSRVRELPCGHIFDPGCVDPYLTGSSSRCPLCKKSVLPPGFVQTTVTNQEDSQGQTTRDSE